MQLNELSSHSLIFIVSQAIVPTLVPRGCFETTPTRVHPC